MNFECSASCNASAVGLGTSSYQLLFVGSVYQWLKVIAIPSVGLHPI